MTAKLDPNHSEVKELTDSGIDISKLENLLNKAGIDYTYASTGSSKNSKDSTSTQPEEVVQEAAPTTTEPTLDTADFQTAAESPTVFQEMLNQTAQSTPAVPQTPNAQQIGQQGQDWFQQIVNQLAPVAGQTQQGQSNG